MESAVRRRRFLLVAGALVGAAGCSSDASKPTAADRNTPDPDRTSSPAPSNYEHRPSPASGTVYEGTVEGTRYVRGPFAPGRPVEVEISSVADSLVAELTRRIPVDRAHGYRPRTIRVVPAGRGAVYLALRTTGGPATVTVRVPDRRVRPEMTGVVFDRQIRRTRSVAAGGEGASRVEVSVAGIDDGEKFAVGYARGREGAQRDARIQFYEDGSRAFDLPDTINGPRLFRLAPLRSAAPFDQSVEVDVTMTAEEG